MFLIVVAFVNIEKFYFLFYILFLIFLLSENKGYILFQKLLLSETFFGFILSKYACSSKGDKNSFSKEAYSFFCFEKNDY